MFRPALLLCALFLTGCPDTYEVVKTDVKSPDPLELLADDKLDDKKPVFDKTLVDRRPVGDWELNRSAAVLRLDLPLVRPDLHPQLAKLYPSYAAAARAAAGNTQEPLLLSVNMIDGKAKQFDDGLYAAIELAATRGVKGRLAGLVDLVATWRAGLPAGSPARPYLGAVLTLAGETPPDSDAAARQDWLRRFQARPSLSRPVGFYTWSEDLQRAFMVLRLLMWEFRVDRPEQLAIATALAGGLDAETRRELDAINRLYAGLSNAAATLAVSDLVGQTDPKSLARTKGVRPVVSVIPATRNREQVLFQKLFPTRLPAGANLMRELVKAIRTGKIDLAPTEGSGWLDHQVYALETLLLPGRGPEVHKLLLTRRYKQRMLQAFQALVTKRKETHIRSSMPAVGSKAAAPIRRGEIKPNLRVEPAPSYFLRTARAYSFLANVLEAALGKQALATLQGQTADGDRGVSLAEELTSMRRLFYGLYLVSCEDLGLRPTLKDDELGAREGDACLKGAEAWIRQAAADPDLRADTRVAVPIYIDIQRRKIRSWATLGVRLARLRVSWARRPSVRPVKGKTGPASWKTRAKDGWAEAEAQQCEGQTYLIAVDEFAEVETTGLAPMRRAQLRTLCDQHRTKAKILEAMATFKP